MIKDRLCNSNIYNGISEGLKIGFEWLRNNDLENIPDGKYEIDGKNVYANLQVYETKTDAKYEAHKKYIDIQYMINGHEIVGVTDKSNCTACERYNDETDLEFLDCNVDEEYQELNQGEFLVLFPHDAHKPSISPGEKLTVKKVVVKVAI